MSRAQRATVALDCMGGDHGPEEAVEAAARLSEERPDIHTLMVGDLAVLGPALSRRTYNPACISMLHTDQWAPQGVSPHQALKQHPNASILVACSQVADGRADAVVTAGSTGAAILAGARRLGRIPGVRRTALAAVTPTEQRHGPRGDPFALLLDVGATLEASARDLVVFGIMGSAYAQAISGTEAPAVGLLNNGTEAHKGPPELVEAYRLLTALPSVAFAGNIEGLDIPKGTVDVVVTNGFLGNVVLKMIEGVGEVLAAVAADASSRKLKWRVGLSMLSSGLDQIQQLLDWESYGGAPILGFQQPLIKAHGRSRAPAIGNACKVAAKAVRGDVVGRVERSLQELSRLEES